jgi:hypothetical protein
MDYKIEKKARERANSLSLLELELSLCPLRFNLLILYSGTYIIPLPSS